MSKRTADERLDERARAMEDAIEGWRVEVYQRADVIDPGSEELWTSLALGYALGRGFTAEEAVDFVGALDARRLL